MNILYIADPNSIHDLKWISSFTRKGIVTAFILPRKIHRLVSESELPGSGTKILEGISDFSIARFYQTLYTAFRIKQIVRENQIDLIHILYAEPNALWCLFRKYFGIPMLISSRGTDVLRTIPSAFQTKNFINFFVTRAYYHAFSLADFVTGTSQLQLEAMKDFSPPRTKMQLVRTGVDIPRVLADTSTFFPFDAMVKYILFPRYIRPLYNHEFCLESIGLLPKEIKQNYKMVFVGKNHIEADLNYQLMLEEKMKQMTDVEFVFLPEMPQEVIFELYKRSSLVVMTPLSDGTPVSAMEAIVCGAKVILGPLKYDEDVFKNWAFKLTTWSSSELAGLMRRLLQKEERSDVTAFFSLVDRNKEMEKMERIYQTVFSRSLSASEN
jgi:glycosyltransferase involved in cell wall biosynthesis